MIKWNKRFEYPTSVRSLIDEERHYDIGDTKLPSVTTILQATQPEEKKKSLQDWIKREGATNAEKIKNEAANRGSIMHRIIEGYLLDQRHADLSDLGVQAGVMAKIIYEEGLKGSMDEIWGTEVTVYYPGLYAGATDLAGIYEGRESIMDFKQSNKPKKKEWIEDYFIQIAAYAMAHDYVYGTQIDKCIIMMCDPNNLYQEFVIRGYEIKNYKHKFLRRLDEYYNKINKLTGVDKT